jgi:hypothetical protein
MGNPDPRAAFIWLTHDGGLLAPARSRMRSGDAAPPQFISPESFSGDELVAMWNTIALTRTEALVLKALQFLDPHIERIAAQVASGTAYPAQSRGGFIVKRAGWEQPVPIGSMGDGIWRMLAMAIAITQCKGGVLLVDEIDTGLHYRGTCKISETAWLGARLRKSRIARRSTYRATTVTLAAR